MRKSLSVILVDPWKETPRDKRPPRRGGLQDCEIGGCNLKYRPPKGRQKNSYGLRPIGEGNYRKHSYLE